MTIETKRSKTLSARTVLKPAEPVEEVTIVAAEPTYNTNDLRVLQGLAQIEYLEPATVVVE